MIKAKSRLSVPSSFSWSWARMEWHSYCCNNMIKSFFLFLCTFSSFLPIHYHLFPLFMLLLSQRTLLYNCVFTSLLFYSQSQSRLDNRFYRRINAVQFDVRYLATNTEKFNQKGSNIVRQARIVTELCLKLIKWVLSGLYFSLTTV